MTKISNVQTKCYVCGTQYSGTVLDSYFSGLPKPKISPLVCPNCHAPYKPLVKLQTGMAKEIFLNILESEDKAEDTLFRFVRTESELEDWINYIIAFASETNFEEWKVFNKKINSKTEDTSIDKLTEMHKSGVLDEILTKISKNVEERIQEETVKYKRN